jgi:hypothetical protein
MKARDFIKDDEKIMVIYTENILLELGDDNTGLTGDWWINPSHSIDRVIIYCPVYQDRYTWVNTLYIGNHAGVIFVEEKERYKIKLAHVQYIGKTKLNWHEFADTGTFPIRYLP